jgi:hypothetical protein
MRLDDEEIVNMRRLREMRSPHEIRSLQEMRRLFISIFSLLIKRDPLIEKEKILTSIFILSLICSLYKKFINEITFRSHYFYSIIICKTSILGEVSMNRNRKQRLIEWKI